MILNQANQSDSIWQKGSYGGFHSVPKLSKYGKLKGPILKHVKLPLVTLDA